LPPEKDYFEDGFSREDREVSKEEERGEDYHKERKGGEGYLAQDTENAEGTRSTA